MMASDVGVGNCCVVMMFAAECRGTGQERQRSQEAVDGRQAESQGCEYGDGCHASYGLAYHNSRQDEQLLSTCTIGHTTTQVRG